MATKNNFYINTSATFQEIERCPDRKPDYISYKKSFQDLALISSEYWYTSEGVIRRSDHWGLVASCNWSLLNLEHCSHYEIKIGFCKFSGFTRLFFIEEINFSTEFEKDNINYNKSKQKKYDEYYQLQNLITNQELNKLKSLLHN